MKELLYIILKKYMYAKLYSAGAFFQAHLGYLLECVAEGYCIFLLNPLNCLSCPCYFSIALEEEEKGILTETGKCLGRLILRND